MSARAARPVSATVASARVAAAGSVAPAYLPPSAWAMMTDSEWATMSCISRAMRERSAAVAICACWSRSTSRRSARSTRALMVSRRERRTRPKAQTARNIIVENIAVKTNTPAASAALLALTASLSPSTSEPAAEEIIAVRWAQRGP